MLANSSVACISAPLSDTVVSAISSDLLLNVAWDLAAHGTAYSLWK